MAKEEYIVNKSASETFQLLRSNITMTPRVTITICGFEKPDSRTYGKYIDANTLIVYQRPMYTEGFQHNTRIEVKEKDINQCTISLKYKGVLFYYIFCSIFIPLVFTIAIYFINKATGYTIMENNIPHYYQGRPYILLIIPLTISILACFFSYILYNQICKTRSFVYRFLSYHFIKSEE